MPYVRKTRDIYSVQGYYSREYGWEEVTQEERFIDALARLREYRENELGTAFRLKMTREPITDLADN